MKKLLLIAALATMATTAMAANPGKDTVATADVTVRAEIIGEGLKITDVYGKPLLLDLGKAFEGEATTLFNEIEYKVSSKAAAETNPIKLDIKLAADTLDIVNTTAGIDPIKANDNHKLTVNLSLDGKKGSEPSKKEILVGQTEVRGTISGSTVTTASSKKGVYVNKIALTATVTQ